MLLVRLRLPGRYCYAFFCEHKMLLLGLPDTYSLWINGDGEASGVFCGQPVRLGPGDRVTVECRGLARGSLHFVGRKGACLAISSSRWAERLLAETREENGEDRCWYPGQESM